MRTFVDTSALYALLDGDDDNHAAAASWFRAWREDPGHALVSHSYVVVETAALVHRRLGPAAVRAFFDAVLPVVEVRFVDEALHARAVAAYLAGLRRRCSFVDWVSFQVMRDGGLSTAFAFDRDFAQEGFALVP